MMSSTMVNCVKSRTRLPSPLNLGSSSSSFLNFPDSAIIESSNLNLSSFYKLKLKATQFKNCSLQEVDFSESNLSAAVFDNCDLSGTMFENTILEKADFRTASNYTIDPEINQIKKAKFSFPDVAGLLSKYDIKIQ